MIIAIDGEASTGKSTQAKKIAKRLNINYRDSGAYYRAITLFLIQNQLIFLLQYFQYLENQLGVSSIY